MCWWSIKKFLVVKSELFDSRLLPNLPNITMITPWHSDSVKTEKLTECVSQIWPSTEYATNFTEYFDRVSRKVTEYRVFTYSHRVTHRVISENWPSTEYSYILTEYLTESNVKIDWVPSITIFFWISTENKGLTHSTSYSMSIIVYPLEYLKMACEGRLFLFVRFGPL